MAFRGEDSKTSLERTELKLFSSNEHETRILEESMQSVVEAYVGFPIEWEKLVRLSLDVYLKCSVDARPYFYRIAIKLFEQHKCQHLSTITKMLCTIMLYKLTYDSNYSIIETHWCATCVMKHEDLQAYSNFDLVRMAFASGDKEFLRILLRYGVPFRPPADGCHCEPFRETGLLKLSFSMPMDDVVKHLRPVKRIRFREHYPETSRRRFFLVMRGMEAIQKKEGCADPASPAQCLQHIFETIPDPFITSAEIRKLTKLLLNIDENNVLLRMVLDVYEAKFPESKEVYQPRSLKHLSRCTIRQCLRKVGALPHGVQRLQHLPDHLRRYIVLEDV